MILKSVSNQQDIQTLCKHLLHLFFLKGVSRMVPLITIPLLIRTLGVEQLGAIKWIEAIGDYFLVFIGYGFKYTATQQIAIYKQDKSILNQLISAVYILKIGAILLTGLATLLLTSFVPSIQVLSNYLWTYYFVVVISMLFPCFIFQGLDQMAWMTKINLFSKVIFVVSVFIWVRTPADSLLYHRCLAMSYLVRLVIAGYLLYPVWGMGFGKPTKAMFVSQLKEGFHLFWGELISGIYGRLPAISLGYLIGPGSVAIYVIGNKAVSTLISMLEPLTQAIYPVVYRQLKENLQLGLSFIVRITLAALVVVGSIGFFYYYFAAFIIQLLAGKTIPEAVWVLKWEAWMPCMDLIISLLGTILLVPLGGGRKYSSSMLIAGLFCMLLQWICIPQWQIPGAVWAILLAKALAIILMLWGTYRQIRFLDTQSTRKL